MSPCGLRDIERGLMKALNSGHNGGWKTHAEKWQQEGVEVPEHEFFEYFPPFQEVGDIHVLL